LLDRRSHPPTVGAETHSIKINFARLGKLRPNFSLLLLRCVRSFSVQTYRLQFASNW
jgi:hypothetical protein